MNTVHGEGFSNFFSDERLKYFESAEIYVLFISWSNKYFITVHLTHFNAIARSENCVISKSKHHINLHLPPVHRIATGELVGKQRLFTSKSIHSRYLYLCFRNPVSCLRPRFASETSHESPFVGPRHLFPSSVINNWPKSFTKQIFITTCDPFRGDNLFSNHEVDKWKLITLGCEVIRFRHTPRLRKKLLKTLLKREDFSATSLIGFCIFDETPTNRKHDTKDFRMTIVSVEWKRWSVHA